MPDCGELWPSESWETHQEHPLTPGFLTLLVALSVPLCPCLSVSVCPVLFPSTIPDSLTPPLCLSVCLSVCLSLSVCLTLSLSLSLSLSRSLSPSLLPPPSPLSLSLPFPFYHSSSCLQRGRGWMGEGTERVGDWKVIRKSSRRTCIHIRLHPSSWSSARVGPYPLQHFIARHPH